MDEKVRMQNDILRIYFQNNKSAAQTVRSYHTEKGLKIHLFDESKVRRIIKKYNEGLFQLQRREGSGRPRIFPDGDTTVTDVAIQQMEENVHGVTSVRNIASIAQCSSTTAYNYLQDAKFKPYKPRKVHQLLPNDFETRFSFAERALNEVTFESVLWTDEAYFTLNGDVNSVRGSKWSPTPTKVLLEKPIHPQKVLVWCGFNSKFIVDPFFVDGTLNSAKYLHLLQNHVEPFLRRKRCVTRTIFQQDGAPPHIEKSVKEYLAHLFPGDKVISRHFNFTWPPRSPDLNPMDFFFWGYLKYLVYRDESFSATTIGRLKEKIKECIATIPVDMLLRVVQSVAPRLEAVIENHGQHIEKFDSYS